MNPNAQRAPELALPAAALGALRRTLMSELGADRGAEVLRDVGHACGDALFHALESGGDPAGLDTERFWRRLAQLFASRGWGTLGHAAAHPGVALLESADWAEADGAGQARRPSCFFTTGVLANLLGRVASADIAVLEVECRSRGDARCRFLFGSPDALAALYDRVAAGEPAGAALEQLG